MFPIEKGSGLWTLWTTKKFAESLPTSDFHYIKLREVIHFHVCAN
jgi:hypothetical protein